MRIAKLLGGAGLLVTTAIVGGTLIGSALAVPNQATTTTTSTDARGLGPGDGEYCTVYLDTLASELGVSRDALLPASKTAAIAAIDAAVADGNLDEDRAAAFKDRIDAIEDDGCAFVAAFGRGLAIGHARGFLHADVLDAAAVAVNLDSADLIDQMAGGASLQEIAEAQGVSYDAVEAAVIDAVQADLDAAVAEGMDPDRADATLERVQTWLDNGGQAGPGPLGGMGRMRGERGGPWH